MRVGKISFHPPRQSRFVSNVTVQFCDEYDQLFITVFDFVIGRSQYGGELYVAVPSAFWSCYSNGQRKTEMQRSVEFPQDVWREVSREILAAFEQQNGGAL